MLVGRLQPGDEFYIDLGKYGRLEYRLIYSNDCRAFVEPLRKTKQRDPLDEISGGRTNISPSTECTIIDEDLEDFMGTSATSTSAAPAKKKEAADTSKVAYKQERPVKEGTIRAKLLAAIQGGETNLNKLAKKFDTPRTNIVSHIRDMWRFHGYGFTVTGDVVKIVPPVGGVMKAKPAAPAKPVGKKKAAKKDPLDDDDDFLS